MFDIGVSELLVIAIVGLIVLGPERLPGVLRTTGLWIGRLRQSFNDIRADIEREAKLGDIKRELQLLGAQDGFKKVADDINGLSRLDYGESAATIDLRQAPGLREASDHTHVTRTPTNPSTPAVIAEPAVLVKETPTPSLPAERAADKP